MRLTQELTFKSLLELIFDKIDQWGDFFIITQKVTLSEATLIMLACFRAIWYVLNLGQSDQYSSLWFSAFSSLAVLHLFSLFLKSHHFRAFICGVHSFVWCSLFFLTLTVSPSAPVAPMSIAITVMSGLLAVKVYRNNYEV